MARPFLWIRCKPSAHHRPPEKRSCPSKASRGSGARLGNLADRFGRGRASADVRAGGSFLVWAGAAAGMAASASRTACCGSSGGGSARTISGALVRGRVSKTIFSGRLLAELIRMIVLSGSAAPARSTGAGRYRSAEEERQQQPADEDEVSDDRHGPPLANEGNRFSGLDVGGRRAASFGGPPWRTTPLPGPRCASTGRLALRARPSRRSDTS